MTPERLRALEMLDFPSPSHARAAVAELAAEIRKGWEATARRTAERDAARAALRGYMAIHDRGCDVRYSAMIEKSPLCRCRLCVPARAALGEGA